MSELNVVASVKSQDKRDPVNADRTPLAVITKIPYGKKRVEHFALYAANWRREKRPLVILIPGMWQQPRERDVYTSVARALVEDVATVAVPEYSPVTVSWPQQLYDIQRSIPVICREATALGGDSQHLILCGDGLGALIVGQLIISLSQDRWVLPSQSKLAGWMAIDGIWAEENIQHLPSKHFLKQLFPDQKSWTDLWSASLLSKTMPPGFLVQLGSASLEPTEIFVRQALRTGSEINLLSRSENGNRIWRGIAKREHPLRVSWRPWLYRISK